MSTCIWLQGPRLLSRTQVRACYVNRPAWQFPAVENPWHGGPPATSAIRSRFLRLDAVFRLRQTVVPKGQ